MMQKQGSQKEEFAFLDQRSHGIKTEGKKPCRGQLGQGDVTLHKEQGKFKEGLAVLVSYNFVTCYWEGMVKGREGTLKKKKKGMESMY